MESLFRAYGGVALTEVLVMLFVLFHLIRSENIKQLSMLIFAGIIFSVMWLITLRGIPANWLGLQDGYLYEMYIKTYLTEYWLKDFASNYLATYPPYFFYIAGKIGAIVGQHDVGRIYKVSIILTYLLAM